jgi:GPH family glycoside/pentoside/hexuronide:cation symporter
VAVIGGLFTLLGYVPNVAQSTESQAGIVWLMSVIPAGFAALAAVLMAFYALDNPTMARIQADLTARKAAASPA